MKILRRMLFLAVLLGLLIMNTVYAYEDYSIEEETEEQPEKYKSLLITTKVNGLLGNKFKNFNIKVTLDKNFLVFDGYPNEDLYGVYVTKGDMILQSGRDYNMVEKYEEVLEITFPIKNNEMIIIENIPRGCRYDVEEEPEAIPWHTVTYESTFNKEFFPGEKHLLDVLEVITITNTRYLYDISNLTFGKLIFGSVVLGVLIGLLFFRISHPRHKHNL